MQTCVEDFVQYLEVEKRSSPHTITAYRQDLIQFSGFAQINSNKDWKEVGVQMARAWIVDLSSKGDSNRTINRKLTSLRSFFRWMKNESIVVENPLSRFKGVKTSKRLPSFVKQEEVDESKLDDLFGTSIEAIRDRLIFELFYQTGIRLSELVELKEKMIFPNYIKVLGKRNKERIIPISENLFKQIENYRRLKIDCEVGKVYLFITKNAKKLNAKFVYRKINLYLQHITNAQKKSPHVLRHTFATHLLNNGAGLETLKELMGHANLSATQVYTHNSFAQINAIYSSAHPRGHKK